MKIEKIIKEFERLFRLKAGDANAGDVSLERYDILLNLQKDFLFSALHQIRQETLEEMEKEIKGKIPTRNTKVIINTGGKDPHNTTPESLVAMGYSQALSDLINLINLIKSKKENI